MNNPQNRVGFAQLQALGLMDRYHLYLINAATLSALSEEYLPIFDDMLRGLRMLPSRRARARVF